MTCRAGRSARNSRRAHVFAPRSPLNPWFGGAPSGGFPRPRPDPHARAGLSLARELTVCKLGGTLPMPVTDFVLFSGMSR